MDFLNILINAIIKRDSDSPLTREESIVYESAYYQYFGDYVNEKTIFKDKEMFEFMFDINKNLISKDELLDISIFRGLLKYKNETVYLEDFCNFVFNSLGYDEEKLAQDLELKVRIFEYINNCYIEARVGKIDLSLFDGIDLSKIKLEEDKQDNPLLFITSLKPVEMKKFEIKNGNFVIVSMPDLHLGIKNIDNSGNLDEENFTIALQGYNVYKDKLLEELRMNGTKVDAIVYVGDVFDAYCRKSNLVLNRNGYDFRDQFITFIDSYNKKNNDCLRISSNDCNFVGVIAGNHDVTLGKERFIQAVKNFGDDVKFLGSGNSRIKINDDYISLIHPNSDDWGIPYVTLFSYDVRNSLMQNVFGFDEYFQICKSCYDSFDDDLKKSKSLKEVLNFINSKIKTENNSLYKFYKPFIYGDNPYFSNYITYDFNGCTLKKTEELPGFMSFKQYLKDNQSASKSIKGKNPLFTANQFIPIMSIVGHFHERLVQGKRKVGSTDNSLPIVCEEGSSYVDKNQSNYTYVSTIYNLDIRDNNIEEISILPISCTLKKVNIDGTIEFQGNIVKHIPSIYSKKKT